MPGSCGHCLSSGILIERAPGKNEKQWKAALVKIPFVLMLWSSWAFVNAKLNEVDTSKCMHGMNQTEAEYSRHGKRSQRASLSQIGPSSIGGITRYILRMRTLGHVT